VTAFGAGSNVASDEKRYFSHHFTFGADLIVFAWLCHYAVVTTTQVRIGKDPFFKWGPFTLLALGCTLVMLDVLRHLILDNRVLANPEVLAMYMDNGHLSPVGRTCKLLSTIGIILIGFSMAWLLGLTDKIYAKMQ